MVLQNTSDYGSGSSGSSPPTWFGAETMPRPRPKSEHLDSASMLDFMMKQCSLDDVRREFQMNGSDSPFTPDEERVWPRLPESLSGLGPSAAYLRQKSWPAPEASPAAAPARPRSLLEPRWLRATEHVAEHAAQGFATSTPIFDDVPAPPFQPEEAAEALTLEQMRVLNSLSDDALYSLLRGMRSQRRNKLPQECRFCKNNGEQQIFYRSHALKDAAGRVACPVLRAFTCRRCGARGDHAHTIKYCPLSSTHERLKSAGMMRSLRMASGRRRNSAAPSVSEVSGYLEFGEPKSTDVDNMFSGELSPQWAALVQKLSLY